jgi:N-sulfoglucosamine sulfohydrolase
MICHRRKFVSRPNIIYIHSHDTGRYLQPYGYAVPTPRIQKLAEEGVLFRQAFAAAPTCCPSRAALLTGQSAHEAGMLGLVHRGFSLKDPNRHLANVLKRNGYSTHLCGIQHEAETPKEIGYDHVLPAESNKAKDVGPTAAAFLRSRPQQPFFLGVGFFETHRYESAFVKGANAEPIGDPRYIRPPACVPDTPDTRRDMADYIESAKRLDTSVGQILDALNDARLAENTLIISTTDHGVPFIGAKSSLTDHGMGVSLILRGPGSLRGGKVIDAMVSQLDVFPTLCELVEIDKPAWLTGKSLLPLVNAQVTKLNDEIFAEITFHSAYDPQRCVRTERWKYIRRFGDRRRPVLCNCDDGLTKTYLVERGLRDREFATEQLYDLLFDPNEASDVAADPANAAVLAEMRQRLESWMSRTNDPLLQGPVMPPPNALVSDQDDLSPNDVRHRSPSARPIPT